MKRTHPLRLLSLVVAALVGANKLLWSKKYRGAKDEIIRVELNTKEPDLPEPVPSPDTLAKQYQMMVDVYKFHFDIVLKFITFYYAITGAILSFYLSQPKTSIMMGIAALALPIVMGGLFGMFALFGAKQVDAFILEISQAADHLHLKPFPNKNLLTRLKWMLRFTGWLSFLTAGGLAWIPFLR